MSARGVPVRSIQAVDLAGIVAGWAQPVTARLAADVLVHDPDRALLLAPSVGDALLAARALRAYPGRHVVYVRQSEEEDDTIDALLRANWTEVQGFELPDPDGISIHVSILRRRQTRHADTLEHHRALVERAKSIARTGASTDEVDACLSSLHADAYSVRKWLIRRLTRRSYAPELFGRHVVPGSGDEARRRLWIWSTYPKDAADLAAAVSAGAIASDHQVLRELESDQLAKALAEAAAHVRVLLRAQP